MDTATADSSDFIATIAFSRSSFKRCLALLTTLPKQDDPEKTGPNMVSIIGKTGNKEEPEIFVIIQDKDGNYVYTHREYATCKVIGFLVDIDPSDFILPHGNRATTINVYQGQEIVNLRPILMRSDEEWSDICHLGAKGGYDALDELLRKGLESKLRTMNEKGYSATVEVIAHFNKRDTK
jgi:hypothetical protein